jgi:uroporphyrinogen-III decarboxylase
VQVLGRRAIGDLAAGAADAAWPAGGHAVQRSTIDIPRAALQHDGDGVKIAQKRRLMPERHRRLAHIHHPVQVDDIRTSGDHFSHNAAGISAAGMEAQSLKERFGEQAIFWGGGVDTQHALPFDTPEGVRAEVKEHIASFGRGGCFVFNTIHNVQADMPTENLLALYSAVEELRTYR